MRNSGVAKEARGIQRDRPLRRDPIREQPRRLATLDYRLLLPSSLIYVEVGHREG